MNSSNSFNICPRCGNSNALNAKYCSRCGGQLKVPEEPVVCPKCHTRNSPMANYCRNCGTTMNVGAETKICPRCGKEVAGDKAVCDCGYSFVTYQQATPSKDKKVETKPTKERKTKNKSNEVGKVYSNKGGRVFAIVALVLLLIFAYYIITPHILFEGKGLVLKEKARLRPNFLVKLDKGFTNVGDESGNYGYDFIKDFVSLFKGKETVSNIKGWGVANLVIFALTAIFAVTAVAHLVVCIVRIITKKRSKKMNLYFLIMAILATVAVALILVFNKVSMPKGILQKIAGWFALAKGEKLGFAIWAIPAYFWVFFLFSLCAKAKKLKEKAA